MPRSRPAASAARRDGYQLITDRILAALERGTVPWRRPWRARGHRNALSAHGYRGINLLLLGLTAFERGYDDPRWLTFRQAAVQGGHVRRGEQGTPVVFWKWLPPRGAAAVGEADAPADGAGDGDEGTGPGDGRVPFLRVYTLFNVAQCAGLTLPAAETVAFDPILRAEAVVAGYRDGPVLVPDAEAAYYVAGRDAVHVPPRGAFRDAHGYYGTLFHELAHSTGHERRLARPGLAEAAVFGSASYSQEELVAEFAAAFLCHEAGIDPARVEQSAAYVASWLHALRNDRRLAVIAASQAQRAADWILGTRPGLPGADVPAEADAPASP